MYNVFKIRFERSAVAISSDNGIYILKSPEENKDGFDYRVTHAQAIENIYWNEETGEESNEAQPKSLVDYFGECEVYTEEGARKEAFRMEKEILSDDFCPILEYGINTIEVPHSFAWYEERAK